MTKVFLPSIPSRYDPLSGKRVPSVDLTKAQSFGDLVPLVPIDQELPTQAAIDVLAEGMAEFEENDYLVAIGDVALVAAAISYACDIWGQVNLLKWDRKRSEYYLETINL